MEADITNVYITNDRLRVDLSAGVFIVVNKRKVVLVFN
jgi:hypothetical protein